MPPADTLTLLILANNPHGRGAYSDSDTRAARKKKQKQKKKQFSVAALYPGLFLYGVSSPV